MSGLIVRRAEGVFVPGNALFYDDFSGDTIARNDSGATKLAWAVARGYVAGTGLEDFSTDNTRPGWMYTVGPGDLPAVVSANFPIPSNRGLMHEFYPQQHTANPSQRQADIHLEPDLTLPPAHWNQRWMLLIDDSATTNTMPSRLSPIDKYDYYASTWPGGFFLFLLGCRGDEHQDPSYSAGQRADFEAGNVPRNEGYFSVQANSAGPLGRLVNIQAVEAPYSGLYQNSSKQHLMPNIWTLIKIQIDMTGANGIVRIYIRQRGTPTFTKILDTTEDGTTWPVDSSLYPEVEHTRTPTTINADPVDDTPGGTDNGRHWRVMTGLEYAETEGDLTVYAE